MLNNGAIRYGKDYPNRNEQEIGLDGRNVPEQEPLVPGQRCAVVLTLTVVPAREEDIKIARDKNEKMEDLGGK
jgi:hypothetical protein